jgi:hypothetical protein
METDTTYAIGDIHGHLNKLRDVHDLIAADKRENGGEGVIVHIGDLVDRGPDSAGVISWLMAGLEAGEPWVVLKGNHDRMMSYYLENIPRRDQRLRAEFEWLHPRLGGKRRWRLMELIPHKCLKIAGRGSIIFWKTSVLDARSKTMRDRILARRMTNCIGRRSLRCRSTIWHFCPS